MNAIFGVHKKKKKKEKQVYASYTNFQANENAVRPKA